MVDDEGVDGAFGGLEFEAELLFDGSEDGDDVGAALLGGDFVGPFEGDVGVAGKSGLVDHLSAGQVGESVGEIGHAVAFAGEDFAGVLAVDVPGAVMDLVLGELDLQAAVGDDEVIDGRDFGLQVGFEVEAVGEQEDDHGLQLFRREARGALPLPPGGPWRRH